jgi:hypothetical protein
VGDVDLCDKGLTEFPLRFNKVTGNFICDDNQLTTLKGCPRWIGGYFDCDCNRLYSLEFSPEYVGSYFSCELNYLTDNYCETEIGTNFFTSIKQDGLILGSFNSVINYKEWRKLYKRKQTLEKIFNI